MSVKFVCAVWFVLRSCADGLRIPAPGENSANSAAEFESASPSVPLDSLTMDSEDLAEIFEGVLKKGHGKGQKHDDPDVVAGCDVRSFLEQVERQLTEQMHDRLSAVFAQPAFSAFVIMSTGNYVCYFDNWLSHAEVHAPNERVVHISLDAQNQQFCENRAERSNMTVQCLDMTGLIPKLERNISAATSTEGHDIFTEDWCTWQHVTWLKPFLLSKVASMITADSNLLLTDVDIVQRGNLLKLCRDDFNNHNLVVEETKSSSYNTGFLYIRQNGLDVLQKWLNVPMNAPGYSRMDQDGLKDCVHNATKHAKLGITKVPRKLIGDFGHWGKLAAHYNGKGQGSKMARMKASKAWMPKSESCE